MHHELKVKFTITDFADLPEDFARVAGIVPTKTWLCGDVVRPGVLKRHDSNGLYVGSGEPPSASLDEHMAALAAKLVPHLDALTVACKGCFVELAVIVYLSANSEQSLPAIHFDPDILAMLNALGAAIDVDLYVFD